MVTRIQQSDEITVRTPRDGAVSAQTVREWRQTALQVTSRYVLRLSPADRDDLYRGWVDGRRKEFLARLHLEGLTGWQREIFAEEFTAFMDDWHQMPASGHAKPA